MSGVPSETSLKTRSEAETSTSTASAKRRKAQVSQLKALQARRVADEAERGLESRRRVAAAAAAAAEAEAQLVVQEARAEAQRAADAAEIDALELRLMEDDDLMSQSPRDSVVDEMDREGHGAPADPGPPCGAVSRPGQMQQSNDMNEMRSQSAVEPRRAHPPEPNANTDSRERTERWLSELPCGDTQRRTSSLPKITLDEFDGSPLEWPRWSGLFRALVHENGSLSDTERLTYLQSCLTGEAREAVRGLLCDGSMYEEALKELEMQFGDSRAVVTATLDGVLKHRCIKENDVESLMRFSRALHAAVSVLSAQGFEADLAAVTNLEQVLEKLPRSLAWQWGQVELKMAPRRPTLGDVDQWLRPLVLAGRRALSVSKQREVVMPRTLRVAPAEPAGRRRGPGGSNQRTTLATATATEPTMCPACDGEAHKLDICPVFKSMAPVDRLQLAREHRRCYRCLGESHWASRCRKKSICGENGCRGKHHPLLHVPDRTSRRSVDQDAPAPAADQPRRVMATALDVTHGPRTTLLQVVPVRVLGPAGKFIDTHALLDSGADTSLCIESVLRELSVTGSTEELTLGNVEGTGMTRPTMKVSLEVAPLSADGQCEPVKVPEVFSVPELNIRPQRVDWSKRAQWKHLEGISIPDTNGRKIELLLGANVLEAILQREARVGRPGQPAAIRTYFGWCLTGSVAQLLPVGSREVLHVARRCEDEEELQTLVRDFWSTEAFGTKYDMKQPRSHEDRLAEEMMESTTKWRGDRYETGLLWKPDCVALPNDRGMALRRLESTEKALRRTPEKAAAYRDIMKEYLDKGYARLLTQEELQKHHPRCWYLPHHAVTSASKPGKFRVVFDAAARFAGTSLNDNLLTGPDLLKQIPGVLLRFRQQPVALIADIEQMFLQVAVREEDQPALRFLWRDLATDRPPSTYQMDRVIFGARSSPASASFVLKKTAEERSEDTPDGRKAAAIVVEDFYMDDMVTSVSCPTQAKTTVIEVTKLVSRGGFRLRKWLSNDKSVLAGIPAQERASSTTGMEKTLPTEKVLGVSWDAERDEMSSAAPSNLANVRQLVTKRGILRVVASLFDPLGFTSPFVLLAKLQLQELWSSQQGWDEPLTTEESDRWAAWMKELPRLSDVKLPRWYGVQEAAPLRRDLHVFCDGSEKAFGAVAYLRYEYSDGAIHCAFVMSKCRVAPLKKLSIVRLETQAAVLAVRLATSVVQELTEEVHRVVFWSDSQVVLSYIANDSKRFHTFVANRVAEIRDTTEPSQWRHVPGDDNPADDCSRGLTASALTKESRWVRGPDFLWRPETCWAADEKQQRLPDEDPEVRVVLAAQHEAITSAAIIPDPDRFSSWLRYRRVVGWMQRFLFNFVATHSFEDRQNDFRSGPLSADELQDAQNLVIREVQRGAFSQELSALRSGKSISTSSCLLTLSPAQDDNGLLRVGGRLGNAPLPESARHPVILPRESRVTALIVMNVHQKLLHAGVNQTLNELRALFWIPRGRAMVKKVLHSCPVCRRRRAKPCQPKMADLPQARFDTRHVFSSVGLDFFGPMLVKTGGRHEKRYGLLVTCLTTRAVHLELCHSLSTDSFLMAFRRFISRRGRPKEVFSDNGTNLRSGEREMRRQIQAWNVRAISDSLAQDDIKWHFNPPGACHMGGVWERLIASVRRALRAVLGQLIVTEEALQTVLTEVEAVVNGRPLTHVSTEVDDLEAITPNHLLLGRRVTCLPPGVFESRDAASRRIWRQTQALTDQFWARWLKEYVPGLTCRRKWTKDTRNLAPGDLVLIAEDNVPRGQWPLGRVMEVMSGPDGRVRSARLRARGGTLHRPATKICLLEEAR